METYQTPDAQWAIEPLPLGTDLVRIDDRWWLILWNDEHVIASPDPNKWMVSIDMLPSNNALTPWSPPLPHVADLCRTLEVKKQKVSLKGIEP